MAMPTVTVVHLLDGARRTVSHEPPGQRAGLVLEFTPEHVAFHRSAGELHACGVIGRCRPSETDRSSSVGSASTYGTLSARTDGGLIVSGPVQWREPARPST